MKHVAGLLAFWIALFWLWLLLVGEWDGTEWIAAACAATVAAALGDLARRRARTQVHVPLGWIAKAWNVPLMVVADFGIVVWALVRSAVRREVVRGTFRSHEFPAGGGDAVSEGVRAWVALAATFSPNAYVVEIEQARRLVLVHDLVPFRESEKPA